MAEGNRDVERNYSVPEFAAKLRRLADAIESGQPFRIQVAGQRISVPRRAEISVEHERGDEEQEVEFQLKWRIADAGEGADDGEADV
ncbi:MAG: amphi-Trp domain-containing protein [Actinomycetota bacterium]|nr:amphi-Trp domain-containing protein [Actinomycetota bacterium]